jgi:hypothetical protein
LKKIKRFFKAVIMVLSKQQKLLINGLELFGVEKGAIVGIMVSLQKPEQMEKLMEYMANNPTMTQEDILGKTAEIAKI